MTRSLILLPLLLAIGCGKGKMPSESVAVSARKDVLQYIESYSTNNASERKLPASVSRLKPMRVKDYNGGLLLIFREEFVEEYGYFYCGDTNQPPAEISNSCKRISPGVFWYYNPG